MVAAGPNDHLLRYAQITERANLSPHKGSKLRVALVGPHSNDMGHGHASNIGCNLGNLAARVGQVLKWTAARQVLAKPNM